MIRPLASFRSALVDVRTTRTLPESLLIVCDQSAVADYLSRHAFRRGIASDIVGCDEADVLSALGNQPVESVLFAGIEPNWDVRWMVETIRERFPKVKISAAYETEQAAWSVDLAVDEVLPWAGEWDSAEDSSLSN